MSPLLLSYTTSRGAGLLLRTWFLRLLPVLRPVASWNALQASVAALAMQLQAAHWPMKAGQALLMLAPLGMPFLPRQDGNEKVRSGQAPNHPRTFKLRKTSPLIPSTPSASILSGPFAALADPDNHELILSIALGWLLPLILFSLARLAARLVRMRTAATITHPNGTAPGADNAAKRRTVARRLPPGMPLNHIAEATLKEDAAAEWLPAAAITAPAGLSANVSESGASNTSNTSTAPLPYYRTRPGGSSVGPPKTGRRSSKRRPSIQHGSTWAAPGMSAAAVAAAAEAKAFAAAEAEAFAAAAMEAAAAASEAAEAATAWCGHTPYSSVDSFMNHLGTAYGGDANSKDGASTGTLPAGRPWASSSQGDAATHAPPSSQGTPPLMAASVNSPPYTPQLLPADAPKPFAPGIHAARAKWKAHATVLGSSVSSAMNGHGADRASPEGEVAAETSAAVELQARCAAVQAAQAAEAARAAATSARRTARLPLASTLLPTREAWGAQEQERSGQPSHDEPIMAYHQNGSERTTGAHDRALARGGLHDPRGADSLEAAHVPPPPPPAGKARRQQGESDGQRLHPKKLTYSRGSAADQWTGGDAARQHLASQRQLAYAALADDQIARASANADGNDAMSLEEPGANGQMTFHGQSDSLLTAATYSLVSQRERPPSHPSLALQPWRPMPGAELLRRYEGRTNPLGFSTMTHVVAERNWQASLRDTKPHEQRAGWR